MLQYNNNDIKNALEILDLQEITTIVQIKKRYRELLKKWHPDTGKKNIDQCKEMTQKIVRSYDILMDYCAHYKISFQKSSVDNTMATHDEKWWSNRFGEDPIWGNRGD